VIEADGELIRNGSHFRRCGEGPRGIGAGGVVRQRIARQQFGDARVHWNDQGVARIRGGVQAGALRGSWHGDHLGVAEHLPEALIFGEIEGAIAAIVQAGNDDGAAVGHAEFIADKGRDALRLREGLAVEEVARIERGIAEELEDRSVQGVSSGAGNDVGESRGAASDFGGHPAGAGADFFDRIDVEVREGGATHFGVARIGAIHGKNGSGAALAVDGELLCEIRGAVGVGHGAGGEEQELTEIALVKGQVGDGFAGQFFAAGAFGRAGFVQEREDVTGRKFQDGRGVARQLHGLRTGGGEAVVFDRNGVLSRGQRGEGKGAVLGGGGGFVAAAGFQTDDRARDGLAMVVAEDAGPRLGIGLGGS
jgi:hypothetical protein